MKRFRILSLAIAVGAVILGILITKPSQPPESYRSVGGPSTDMLRTSGVFKPGGYVDFEFSPGIKSIRGLYNSTVITLALDPNYETIDDVLWPYDRSDSGRDWERSLVGSSKTFTVAHRVAIPDDKRLAGMKVVFLMDYHIYYPKSLAVNSFQDKNEKFEQSIQIELMDESLTSEEKEWMEQSGKPRPLVGLLNIVITIVVFAALYFAINPPKSRKRGV